MRLAPQRRPRRAATIVETAMVLTIFLMFLFGIIEYGRLLMTKQLMDSAARVGARWAVVNTSTGTTAQVQAQVDSAMTAVARQQLVGYVSTTNITVFAADASGNPIAGSNWNDASFGGNIGVSISGTYKSILPNLLLMNSTFTLSAKSVMASEAN